MIEQIAAFFTIEMIYLWLNFGILPFWFVLMFFPKSKICGLLVTSIFPFFILAAIYCYLVYYYFIGGYDFDKNFILYLSLFNLSSLFEDEGFLILFWTHFLAVNFFCGAWIVRDSLKFFMPKYLTLFPLLITYFIGPLGLFIYWIIRIFYAKRIGLID